MLLVSHRPGPDRPVGDGRHMTPTHSSTGDTHARAHPSRPAPRTRRQGLTLGATLAAPADVAAEAPASSRRPTFRRMRFPRLNKDIDGRGADAPVKAFWKTAVTAAKQAPLTARLVAALRHGGGEGGQPTVDRAMRRDAAGLGPGTAEVACAWPCSRVPAAAVHDSGRRPPSGKGDSHTTAPGRRHRAGINHVWIGKGRRT